MHSLLEPLEDLMREAIREATSEAPRGAIRGHQRPSAVNDDVATSSDGAAVI